MVYILGAMTIETVCCQFLQYLVVFCNHIDESVKDTYHFICESVTFSGFRYINAYILPMYDRNKVCHKFAEI